MTAVIEVKNLHKNYGQMVAVEGISFSVQRGEIFGIVGPNGAGKTTTIEAVIGLRKPDSGSISVLGLDPQRRPLPFRGPGDECFTPTAGAPSSANFLHGR